MAMSFDVVGKQGGEPGRRRAYKGGFLLHYLDALVYPNISSVCLPFAGVVVCTLNLVLYGRAFGVGRKRSQQLEEAPR
jgi:hypothetical protein